MEQEEIKNKKEDIGQKEVKRSNTKIFLKNKSVKGRNLKKKTTRSEFRTVEVCVLLLLTCFVSLIVGVQLEKKFVTKSNYEQLEEVDSDLQAFIKNYNYLVDHYYEEVDKKELLNEAFKSMVDSLGDDFSGSIGDSESNNFDITLEGSYEGLGIEIVNDKDYNILIYSIIPNSPASKSELKVGDVIKSINGQDLTGKTTTEFVNLVKQSKEKDFTLEVERDGDKLSISLHREFITLESVVSNVFEQDGKKIGYLRVSIFAANTYQQFASALSGLEKQNIDSLVIDLRGNSGGHLTAVHNMISLFLDSSHVIYQTQDRSDTKKVYSTGNKTKNYPIVLLGNSGSASASEVMIGALTEEYGAVLIGEKTFGKGTVQELHSLSNGDEYKFTTKKWLTPKGNWIHEKGITPTIEITLDEAYYQNPTDDSDNQLQEALRYLREN